FLIPPAFPPTSELREKLFSRDQLTLSVSNRWDWPSASAISKNDGLVPASNFSKISRPMQAASKGGTALPTCLIGWREVPENVHQSGKVWIRALSLGVTSRGS